MRNSLLKLPVAVMLVLALMISAPSHAAPKKCSRTVLLYVVAATLFATAGVSRYIIRPALMERAMMQSPAQAMETGHDFKTYQAEAKRRVVPVEKWEEPFKHNVFKTRAPAIFFLPDIHTCTECSMHRFALNISQNKEDVPIILGEGSSELEPDKNLFMLGGMHLNVYSAPIFSQLDKKSQDFSAKKLSKQFGDELISEVLSNHVIPEWQKSNPDYLKKLEQFQSDIKKYEELSLEVKAGFKVQEAYEAETIKVLLPWWKESDFISALSVEVSKVLLERVKNRLPENEYATVRRFYYETPGDFKLGTEVTFILTEKARNNVAAETILQRYMKNEGQDIIVNIGAAHVPMVYGIVKESLRAVGMTQVPVRVVPHFLEHKEHANEGAIGSRMNVPLQKLVDEQSPEFNTSFPILYRSIHGG